MSQCTPCRLLYALYVKATYTVLMALLGRHCVSDYPLLDCLINNLTSERRIYGPLWGKLNRELRALLFQEDAMAWKRFPGGFPSQRGALMCACFSSYEQSIEKNGRVAGDLRRHDCSFDCGNGRHSVWLFNNLYMYINIRESVFGRIAQFSKCSHSDGIWLQRLNEFILIKNDKYKEPKRRTNYSVMNIQNYGTAVSYSFLLCWFCNSGHLMQMERLCLARINLHLGFRDSCCRVSVDIL